MNDTQIKSFMAAAKHLNFTIAATHLFVSQSVLSKHIAALERELGVLLFKRKANGLELTDEGRIFASYIEKISVIYEEAIQKMNATKMDSYNLSLGMLEGQYIDPQIYECIVKTGSANTDCRVQYKYFPMNNLVESLINGEVDIIITAESLIGPIPQNLNSHLIRESDTCILMSQSHPLVESSSLTFSDVKDDVFIVLDYDRYPLLAKAQSRMSALRGEPNRHISAPNFETMALWVEMNVGVTSASSWDPMTRNTGLRAIKLEGSGKIREVMIWTKKNKNPLIASFIKEIDAHRQQW